MFFKKKVPTYMFYGGAFGAAVAAIALASTGVVGTTENTEAFLEQTSSDMSTALDPRIYQQIACADIPYDISAVDVVLSGGSLLSSSDVAVSFGTLSGSGSWEKLRKRDIATSNTVSFSESSPSSVRVSFVPPVARDTLCPSVEDMIYLTMRSSNNTATGPRIHGSANNTAYRGPLYNCVLENGSPCLGDVQDISFVLRSAVNTAPNIAPMDPRKVNELDTLTFTLTATDPNGDTITWGSPNLPAHATLDSVTGVFTITPTSDQVGGYEIVFTATDDGGPVQMSSSIEVTVTVVDVETPIDTSRTLEEIVRSYMLEKGVEQAYLANIKNVEKFIADGQTQAAVNQLSVLENKLEQDKRKESLTEAQYTELLEAVTALRATLEVS